MHLVACPTPQEPLESAPKTALLADLTEGERWDGFWSSDVYFVRCTRDGGAVEWFRLADDEIEKRASSETRDVRRKDTTRVLAFPSRPRLQTRVVVAKGPDGRGMLVGMARRQGGASTVRRAGE